MKIAEIQAVIDHEAEEAQSGEEVGRVAEFAWEEVTYLAEGVQRYCLSTRSDK